MCDRCAPAEGPSEHSSISAGCESMPSADAQARANTSNSFGPTNCTCPEYDVKGCDSVWHGALGLQSDAKISQ